MLAIHHMTVKASWSTIQQQMDQVRNGVQAAPDNWFLLTPGSRNIYALTPGKHLLVTAFSHSFFQEGDPVAGRDFAWAIRTQLSRHAIADVLDTFCKKPGLLRHPLIRHEPDWMAALIHLDPTCRIHARYEGDDILIVSAQNTPQQIE